MIKAKVQVWDNLGDHVLAEYVIDISTLDGVLLMGDKVVEAVSKGEEILINGEE